MRDSSYILILKKFFVAFFKYVTAAGLSQSCLLSTFMTQQIPPLDLVSAKQLSRKRWE